jgi:hypothetical protein
MTEGSVNLSADLNPMKALWNYSLVRFVLPSETFDLLIGSV